MKEIREIRREKSILERTISVANYENMRTSSSSEFVEEFPGNNTEINEEHLFVEPFPG